MSRYGPRYSQGEPAYRDAPPSRWDADRFTRERETRQYYEDDQYVQSPRRVSRAAPVYEREQYYEDDRYGPRGVTERRYFEEEDYYDPRAPRGQMVPYRTPPRPEAPPRPGIIRRQSSLDTFDRVPPRRYGPPPRIGVPVPEAPGPGANRYRRPRERDYRDYDEIAIQEPEYYGDDGFREYREREWITHRRGGDSHERSRPESRGDDYVEEDRKTVISEHGGRETIIEKKEEKVEKPYPRKGKTKMPKRLVHTKVLFDLGYPYYEEDERTIIIEKALGPDNIDEIFVMSKEYREREVGTTRLIEAPPPAEVRTTTTTTIVGPEEVREDRTVHEEEIVTKPLSEAPRSVREWDNLTAPSVHSHRSHSRRGDREEERETIVEKKTIIEDSSPHRRHRHRSRRRGSSDESETIIEKKIVREDEFPLEESASLDIGPLSLVRSKSRSERDIKREIHELERERRDLRRERRHDREGELIIERRVSRSPSPTGREIIVERRGDDVLEVRRDRRDRSRSRPPPPSGNLIRNMMYTLT